MTISYEKFHLKEVINASGKMTILGVSKVSEAVLAAQRFGGEHFFEMSELSVQTGAFLANLLKVEDAQIVSSASAGIAQSVAALMISEKTAAILYIKSHHTVQKSMLTVAEAAKVAQRHKVPLIVDAAAEEDLFKYTEAGADLVIYSGAKAIEGPSAGLVVGKKEYIDWVRLQGKGIGRAMKIGKDNILGFTQAVEEYLAHGSESGASMQERLKPFVEAINNLSDLTAKIVQDGAGRDIYRASVKVDGRKTAKEVIQALKAESPAIYTREYQANNGIIEFDIRSVNQEEMNKIVQRLQEIMDTKEK